MPPAQRVNHSSDESSMREEKHTGHWDFLPLPCQENPQRVINFAQFLTFTAILPSKGELGGSRSVSSFLIFQDRRVRGGFLASFLADGAWSPAMANQTQLHQDSDFALCV